MKSISTLAIIAATACISNAIAAPSLELYTRQYKTLTYMGCFSSGEGLTKNSTYIYNSKGWCQMQCVPAAEYAVQATYNSDECWCGDDLPPAADLVDDSKCNSPCAGTSLEMCGGTKLYWSVYLTGTESSAPNYDPAAAAASSASSASASASSVAATHTTSIAPSVVTVGGQTVTVQASSAAAASSSVAALSENKSSGPNKAGIAAGVVVGVLVAAAIAGGIFIVMRNKKRREVEEEYRRNAAVNNFVTGGKVPVSSGGSFTDTRLDPTLANRRMSDGSIADNQDYSRRILKVTNA
ncbi:d3a998fd-2dce-4e0b-a0ca-bbd7b38cde67 [Sclerotinia trifoliorum]|uniref:D3a998fd-2dce-4e0b-a0ca-bbd7b38cde67 n=1 Tax=Sclerotinia trifoliorum TaxID=28548 RepID=A0A8H2W543_9HELO|nr:d3a998fd-2dce-4e0b-a0ca-bbd7b38cde67 [Sclerotinia trifoliorum]